MNGDGQLKETLKWLAGPVDRSGAWASIEARAEGGRSATAPPRKLSLRVAAYATVTVVLLAALVIGGFEAVNYLTRPHFVLAITDDNLVGPSGQAAGTAASSGTWERLPLTAEPGPVDFLAVGPNTPSTLFAKTAAGVFRSTDGGESWTQTLSFSAIAGQVLLTEFDPADPATIYMLVVPRYGAAARLLRSDDGGVNWVETATKPATRLGILPPAVWFDTRQSPSTVYALGFNGGVLRSTDRGETWTDIGQPEASPAITGKWNGPVLPAAAADALDAFLASFQGTVLDAETGIAVGVTAPGPSVGEGTWVGSIAVDPRDPSTFYAATNAGVYKSTDGGATWRSASVGLADAATTSVVPNPRDPAIVYASTHSGIYRSTTSGADWTRILDGEGSIVLAPSAPSRLYSWTSTGLYRSDDGGDDWSRLTGTGLTSWYWLEPDVNGHPASGLVLVAAADPDVVFAVSTSRDRAGSSLYRSDDGGLTWTEVLGGARFIVPDPKSPSTLFAAAGKQIFRSLDTGLTWTLVSPKGWGNAVVDIAVNPSDPSVYAIQSSETSGDFSLYRSGDGGNTWERVQVEVPASSIRRLLLDIRSDGGLYVLTFDKVAGLAGGGLVRAGIYYSADRGGFWENISEGLPRAGYYSIALDPGSQPGLYVATASGLFKWVPNVR